MRSIIMFRIDPDYARNKNKTPMEIVLSAIKEHLPGDITQSPEPDGISFTATEWDIEVTESSLISDPSTSAITVVISKIPSGNLLMHHLMLLNKETRSDVIKEYKRNYPQT